MKLSSLQLRKSETDLHIPFGESLRELAKRRGDVLLAEHVNKYLGGNVPSILFDDRPVFVLWRHIATPDSEFDLFMLRARSVGAKAVVFEYTSDIFCSRNPDKHALAKMHFYVNTAANGNVNTITKKLVDFKDIDGVEMKMINTVWDISLPELHHRFLRHCYPNIAESICDLSPWLHAFGTSAESNYKQVLSLFIRHAILFENFRVADDEASFTEKVVRPAFDAVSHTFGLQPLVVRLVPADEENDWQWWTYCPERKRQFDDCVSGFSD